MIFYSILWKNKELYGINNVDSNQNNISLLSSAFDSFISSYPLGYGSYEIKKSDLFYKNDSILLYVEPIGFTHKLTQDSSNTTLFSISFASKILISNENGTLIKSIENIPTKEIISYHKNKEVYLVIDFKPEIISGKYYIQYFITDKWSNQTIEIIKSIKIL